MMPHLRYTLLTDGSSDQALLPILTWLISAIGYTGTVQPAWADLSLLPRRPETLSDRMESSVILYPCNLLFVHRDAEREPYADRKAEIARAVAAAKLGVPVVGVIPVRMQEAWLLINERAIRRAAGNPSGRVPLSLPALKDLEALPTPKNTLYDLLKAASELRGRRLTKLHEPTLARRVTELIDDFAPLRALSAFQSLEADLKTLFTTQGWV